jgi:membrane protease YdiL (CAAX protease family)
VGLAVAWLIVLVAFSLGIGWLIGGELAGLLGEGSIGVAAFLAGRSVVRQRGSWRAAFGWSLPRWNETGLITRWVGWQYVAQFIAGLVMIAIFPPVRGESPSNTDFLDDLGWWGLVIAVPTTVLLAPVVEELFFRGLLLRAAMRRFSFWPSAVLTSALFGSLHAPAAESAPAGVLLGMLTGVFGVVQCQLVRRAGRLGPAMGVHAVQNGVSVTLALI